MHYQAELQGGKMKKQEFRKRQGMRTVRQALKLLASLKSVAQLTQERSWSLPERADRVSLRDQLIRETIDAAQMALTQAEGEI